MTNSDLIEEVNGKTGKHRDDVQTVVWGFTAVIKDALSAGYDVNIEGFGSFSNKAKREFEGVVEQDSEFDPKKHIPTFTPAEEFFALYK